MIQKLYTNILPAGAAIVAGFLCIALLAPTAAYAFFSDIETGDENNWTAGHLDMVLSLDEFEGVITNEDGDEVQFDTTVSLVSESADAKYVLSYEYVSGDVNTCGALSLSTTHGTSTYDGPLVLAETLPTNDFGLWNSFITVTDGYVIPLDEECVFDLVFTAWQEEIDVPTNSGFSDEERIRITVGTAGGDALITFPVVLNEFLPAPDGILCADGGNDCVDGDDDFIFDFGDDSDDKPQGEWVELYNLTSVPVDLTGWYVSDASGGVGNTIEIETGNTLAATTTIPANGYLVVYMNKAIWNNTGDTVKLYNNVDVLQDSYAYTSDYEYCFLKPTAGDTNDETPSGSSDDIDCTPGETIPKNKSYARIPDGTGSFIDPIPTPNIANTLDTELSDQEVEDITAALEGMFGTEDTEADVAEDEQSIVPEEVIAKPEETVVVPEEPTTPPSGEGNESDDTEGEVETPPAGEGQKTPSEDAEEEAAPAEGKTVPVEDVSEAPVEEGVDEADGEPETPEAPAAKEDDQPTDDGGGEESSVVSE